MILKNSLPKSRKLAKFGWINKKNCWNFYCAPCGFVRWSFFFVTKKHYKSDVEAVSKSSFFLFLLFISLVVCAAFLMHKLVNLHFCVLCANLAVLVSQRAELNGKSKQLWHDHALIKRFGEAHNDEAANCFIPFKNSKFQPKSILDDNILLKTLKQESSSWLHDCTFSSFKSSQLLTRVNEKLFFLSNDELRKWVERNDEQRYGRKNLQRKSCVINYLCHLPFFHIIQKYLSPGNRIQDENLSANAFGSVHEEMQAI